MKIKTQLLSLMAAGLVASSNSMAQSNDNQPGYAMTITANIDELDIDNIEMGMEVDITQSGAESEPEEVIEVGGITITVEGGSSEADYWSGESCWGALDVSLALKDGTVLETPSTGIGSRCEDGVTPDGVVKTPFVEKFFGYAEASNVLSPRVIDPSQVDYILVCGVRIDLPQ